MVVLPCLLGGYQYLPAKVVTLLTKLRQVVAAGHRFYATFVKQQEIFGELWAIFEFGRLGKWSAKDFCPRGSVFFAASAIRFRVAKRSYFPHASAYGVPSVWWLLSPYKPAMLAIETCTHSAKLCGFFARIEMRKKPGPPQQTSRTVFLCTHAPTQGVLSAWQRSSGKSFVQVGELKIVGAAQVFVACLVRVCAAQDSQDYRPPAKSAANAVVRHLPSDLAHAAAHLGGVGGVRPIQTEKHSFTSSKRTDIGTVDSEPFSPLWREGVLMDRSSKTGLSEPL